MSHPEPVVERLLTLVAEARAEGWYEDASGWGEVDALLAELGYGVVIQQPAAASME